MPSYLITIFTTIFIAELGDKTQIATTVYASKEGVSPLMVFFASSLALVASCAIAVLLGSYASKYLAMIPLKLIAGICFIAMGISSILEHFYK